MAIEQPQVPKLTYLPLIMDRWTAGTRHLTYEQKGFYIDLLIWMFETGKPVKDAAHAARILKCDPRTSRRLLADLRPKFRLTSAGLRHRLLDKLLRNAGHVKGLETNNFPLDPDPDPEEKKKNPSGSKKKRNSAAETGKRLEEDWQPDTEIIAWARQTYPQINTALETDRFRDHWLAKPGKDGRKVDWGRTWRNWIRKAADDAARRKGKPQATPQRPRLPDDYYNPDGSVNERYREKANASAGRRRAGPGPCAAEMAGSQEAAARDNADSASRCGEMVDYDAGAALDAIRTAASGPGCRR